MSAVEAVALTAPTLVAHEHAIELGPAAKASVELRARARRLLHFLHLDVVERTRMGRRCVEVDRMLDELRAQARAERREPSGIGWSAGYHDAVAAAMAAPRGSRTYVGRTRQRNAHEHVARAIGDFDIAPAIAAEAIIARDELRRHDYQTLVRPVRMRGVTVPEWGVGDA